LSGINRSGVASDLQVLGFGGRDAGDATAVSYKIDSDYHFSTLMMDSLDLEPVLYRLAILTIPLRVQTQYFLVGYIFGQQQKIWEHYN